MAVERDVGVKIFDDDSAVCEIAPLGFPVDPSVVKVAKATVTRLIAKADRWKSTSRLIVSRYSLQ